MSDPDRQRAGQGGGCPVGAPPASPRGCPASDRAMDFDMFDGPYQLDPAEALRWSRQQEPVFFAPKLGYWVVSRYEHVKAVFRDNITFSPAVALEKMTPTSDAANAVLARYGYAMNRTLVNEDEPAHMARRRALMQSFEPAELAHHEAMVRRLTRSYIDRLIDRGEADLVDDMLWEIPLTVALHFLGVPEEDMSRLREYSIAHTVNTWGRPRPEEQLAVAEAVGKFWQFAGDVLDRMRADPEGPGWMQYAIRQQRELPEVVTDSYLHSMMMAGIVAAHETTAHAAANAFRLMLEHRGAWDAICADPSLIPNAVEECLRHAGSVVAWRRIATVDARIGEVDIPAGARLLIVSSSANHDERHFDDPDRFDIHRHNTTDHLTFGYGSHQCMGKNLARMEMRIFFEEISRRIPHVELVPDQSFTYLPNTSFRGPDHLLVRWDPARNPERHDRSVLDRHADFPIGAPTANVGARDMRVTAVDHDADDIVTITLEDARGHPLPAWTPGAHIDLMVGDYVRKYSLCGRPSDRSGLQVSILRDRNGRGGSDHIHEAVHVGMTVRMRGPRNHFRLDEGFDRYLLIAAGIGITPILAMADRLKEIGKDYVLHYAVRSRAAAGHLARLMRDHAGRAVLHAKADGQRLDLERIVRDDADARIYACGPERLLAAIEALVADRPDRLHAERFAVAGKGERTDDRPFEVELRDSELAIEVKAGQSLLEAARAIGIDLPSDCEEGLCGTCEVEILSGEPDHRDAVLTAAERAAGRRMMACCSRARSGKLVIAL
ncbi:MULTISPECIES: cytochrome P450/oxidoreductase [unclassified Sphingomonas]|uniref:cytochrome P450/oxidoreductase n=1 Tax=unclassified Sphingomonas TaxID=196159 RepID=UPI001F18B3A1|nr:MULTISPECIES: cytochrome P450/oxidoreductase [unclassified Sphingomonas]